MLYQYKLTGGLVEVISEHGEGIMMCVDAQDEVLYVEKDDLTPHLESQKNTLEEENRVFLDYFIVNAALR